MTRRRKPRIKFQIRAFWSDVYSVGFWCFVAGFLLAAYIFGMAS